MDIVFIFITIYIPVAISSIEWQGLSPLNTYHSMVKMGS